MNNHKVLTHTNRIESYKEDIYMKWFDNTALTVVIIGAVNWFLIGIFRLDLHDILPLSSYHSSFLT